MYERFTDRARKVVQLAQQESLLLNHEYVGTEHLLIGIVKEGSGVAAHALRHLGIDLRKIRLEVDRVVQPGPKTGVVIGKLPYTPRAKRAIEYAMESARDLNHRYLGTEHLLLGLLIEKEGVAHAVLSGLGIKVEDVREEVLNLIGRSPEKDEDPRQPKQDRTEEQTKSDSLVEFFRKIQLNVELANRMAAVWAYVPGTWDFEIGGKKYECHDVRFSVAPEKPEEQGHPKEQDRVDALLDKALKVCISAGDFIVALKELNASSDN